MMAALFMIAGDSSTVWKFDSVENIVGQLVHVLGHPRAIDTPKGKAVEFNGVTRCS